MGGNQNASGWEKVGNQVRLIDSAAKVNIGNHSPTEKLDVKGNMRVREVADLPDTTHANNQLKFRSLFVDEFGKFYRGQERRLHELPPVVWNPPTPSLGWQPSGSNIVWTERLVGVGTDNPGATLDVSGSALISEKLTIGSGSIVLDGSVTTTGGMNSIYTNNGNLFIQSQNFFHTIIGLSSPSLIGIGTVTPQKKLHIKTSHSAFAIGSHNGIRLEDVVTDPIPAGSQPPNSTWDIEPIGGTGKLHIGTPGNPVMTFTDQWRVGIGTQNPVARFHVGNTHPIIMSNETTFLFGEYIGFNAVLEYSPSIANLVFKKLGNVDPGGSQRGGVIMASDNFGNFYMQTYDAGSGGMVESTTAFSPQFTFTRDGRLGLGTTIPQYKLHLHQSDATALYSYFTNDHTGSGAGDGFKIGIDPVGVAEFIQQHNGSLIKFKIKNNAGNIVEALNINENGQVDVCGSVRAKEFRANLTGCDFVFEKDYSLIAIKKRKEKVLKQKHLFYIIPASSMQKDGASLGELTQGIIQNLEEHELYLFQIDERNDMQDEEVKSLKEQIKQQQQVIEKQGKEIERMNNLLENLLKK